MMGIHTLQPIRDVWLGGQNTSKGLQLRNMKGMMDLCCVMQLKLVSNLAYFAQDLKRSIKLGT